MSSNIVLPGSQILSVPPNISVPLNFPCIPLVSVTMTPELISQRSSVAGSGTGRSGSMASLNPSSSTTLGATVCVNPPIGSNDCGCSFSSALNFDAVIGAKFAKAC